MTMRDIHMQEDNAFVPDNTTGTVFIRIAVPELKNQKCLQFQLDDTVWQAKQRILAAFAKDLRDALNYGLYVPPTNGRAGKFLDEERFLKEYPLQGPIGFLEFKYKRRVYKMMQLNPRKLKQLHSKTNLKHFLEHVRNGNTEKINKMTNKGLDPNFHDQDNGETPLTTAATLGKDKTREVMIALVSGGSHIDFRNRSGLTPVHRAAIVGNVEAIKTLLDLGASPDFKDGRGLTPLYYSVSNDTNQACTEMLLHERAFVGTSDDQGWCEIHQACRYGRVQHLEHLLFYGADIDVQNASGNTPLHVCAAYNQEACARVLLFRGADRSVLNFSNQTPYQVAVIANAIELADLIKNHKDEDAVPIRELPIYSERRKNLSVLNPSMRLLRSRSDPRLHASVLEERMLQLHEASTASQGNLASMHDFYDTASYGPSATASSHDYNSDSPCSLSVSSASSGPLLGVTDQGYLEGRTMDGREGCFPATYVDEVQLRKGEKAGSLGDMMNGDMVTMHRNTLAALVNTERENAPRRAVLHKCAEGYGFVLRGAKSQTHAGNISFQPTAEFPAPQYLDSVDPGSQAERAGLRSGDFILEINGEGVTRASHERVVQLIRGSGDVLAMKVVSVRTPGEQPMSPTDWFKHQDGSRTLPSRNKKQAPQPPRRDPQTSLSYSKATSKSMSEGLAEIEKLDQTIAEFDSQSSNRRHSMHSLDTPQQQPPLAASVRGTHTMKRVSVIDMVERDVMDEAQHVPAPAQQQQQQQQSSPSLSKLSPAEMRIKKYHKKMGSGGSVSSGSVTMERSKSTPDLADTDFGGSESEATLRKQQQPEGGGGKGDKASATWSKSHSVYVPPPGLSLLADATGAGNQADGDRPDVPSRAPMPKRRAPDPPSKGEVVRINTGANATTASTGSTVYANVSEDIAARKRRESQYESSFRPGTSAQLGTDDPSVMTKSLEQAKLQHKKSASVGSVHSLPEYSNTSGKPPSASLVSFAEDRIYEQAQTFIKKHPNAKLLVTADVHGGKKGVGQPVRPPADRQFYEPEPDYDVDSGDEATAASRQRMAATSVITSHTTDATIQPKDSSSSPAVTVISVSSKKDGNRQPDVPPTAPKPGSPQRSAGSSSSPTKSLASPQLDSSGGAARTRMMIPPSSSASSSASNSRRGSVQSNASLATTGSSHDGSAIIIGRDLRVADVVPAASSVVMVHHQQQRDSGTHAVHHTPPPQTAPPPPPASHSPPAAPPPPPPPPPPAPPLPPFDRSPSHLQRLTEPSKSSSSPNVNNPPQAAAPALIPASDILAAVAKRQARIDTDGLRVTERQSSAPALGDMTVRNQEALKAAINQRRSMLENASDTRVVEDIEARLNKNRKLQAAKYFSSNSDTLRKAKRAEADSASKVSPAATTTAGSNAAASAFKQETFSSSSGAAGDKASESKRPIVVQSAAAKPAAPKPVTETAAKKPMEIAATAKSVANIAAAKKPVEVQVATKKPVAIASNKPVEVAIKKPAAVNATNVSNKPAEVAASKPSSPKPPVEILSGSRAASTASGASMLGSAIKPKEIMTHKAAPFKAQAPRPPTATTTTTTSGKATASGSSNPLPDKGARKTSVDTEHAKTATAVKASTITTSASSLQKTTAPATSQKNSNTTPMPKIGTIKSNDFLALAEKARQDYLQKIGGSSGSTSSLNRAGAGSAKPTSPQQTPEPKQGTVGPQATTVEVRPVKDSAEVTEAKISIKDRISKLNMNGSTGSPSKGYEVVVGVTEDHSHTEPSFSNGTLRNHRTNTNGVRSNNSSSSSAAEVVAPPSDFVDNSPLTHLEILPPPPSFSGADDATNTPPAFGYDDAASFVSSVSSLSTLSSEHGDTGKGFPHRYDDLIVPPPPPPEFGDVEATSPGGHQGTENVYEEIPGSFIPPPVQFTTEHSGGGRGGGGGVGKGERPFQKKTVNTWRCEDVLDWLDSLDMAQYKQSFARNAVDGPRLQGLERNDYIELGVTQVGHRMDLQRSIKRLMLRHGAANATS